MKIIFTTNLDRYNHSHFPDNFTIPPRIGERVEVQSRFHNHYTLQKLPIELQVTNVTWTSTAVVISLWYTETVFKSAKLNNIDLF